MKITDIHTEWSEAQGLNLLRTSTGNEYTFIHFLSHANLHSTYIDLRVDPGACIVYDKHVRLHISAPNEPLLCDFMHFRGDISAQMHKYMLRFNRVYYPTCSDAVTQLMRSMEQEFLNAGKFAEDVYTAGVTSVLLTLTRHTIQPCARSVDTQLRKKLSHTRSVFLSRYTEAWDTKKLARLAGMGEKAFMQAYRHCFGITPKQDLLACRIGHAKSLLLQEKYSVSQIAALCGFKSVASFSRKFKAATGATPRKFFCL